MRITETRFTVKQIERFWSKVDIRGKDECWNWTGNRSEQGYGYITFTNNYVQTYLYAHRLAYELEYGVTPYVCRHTCDNPPCCNPFHLCNGNHQDNSDDMVARGRSNNRHRFRQPACQ